MWDQLFVETHNPDQRHSSFLLSSLTFSYFLNFAKARWLLQCILMMIFHLTILKYRLAVVNNLTLL